MNGRHAYMHTGRSEGTSCKEPYLEEEDVDEEGQELQPE